MKKAFALRLLDLLASAFCRLFGLSRGNEWSARVAENMRMAAYTASNGRGYRYVASSPLLLMRARTMFSKEPETISWIGDFGPQDVFFDIGANVGIYTIFAASRCRRVYAFEPEASNFSVLNWNIQLNGVGDKAIAFPIALSDTERLDRLHVADLRPGAALHVFGGNVDFKGDRFSARHLQGCLALTLDDLVNRHGLEFPTRIKIDVDGLEGEVLRGGTRVLSDRRMRGLLVEINENDPEDIALVGIVGGFGLRILAKGPAVIDASGKAHMRNYIFERDGN